MNGKSIHAIVDSSGVIDGGFFSSYKNAGESVQHGSGQFFQRHSFMLPSRSQGVFMCFSAQNINILYFI
ncbi:MAG: hypothetical protein WCG98_05915, partial [bacterium]